MSNKYSQDLLKISVAKVLQTIGWHSINSTPMDILTDVLAQYLTQVAKTTNDYANEFGFVEPNLDHLGLAFRDFHISLSDLEEYVTYVNFGQGPTPVPSYPVAKENHLNFLKPGSKEVVTRPVHIHEHLPPMFPLLETAQAEKEMAIKKELELEVPLADENSLPVFKKPAEVALIDPFKRPKLLVEEEGGGRPTREISSVMMTTSGFLSPAREGKLPESRTPLASLETTTAPPNTPSAEVPKKPVKPVKKVEKKKVGKELFKSEDKIKKPLPPKDLMKLKQPRPTSNTNQSTDGVFKMNKALAAALQKTEKLNTTITPIPMKPAVPPPQPPIPVDNVDKLFTEPDKKKVNILKKISNVKNEKPEVKKKEESPVSRESSPDLVIDESIESLPKVHHISDDITIELIQCPTSQNEKNKRSFSDDDSPPGTPSTPKTPEMVSQSPPVQKEKRRKKEKTKLKKLQKMSPALPEPEIMDIELDRPKTPEVTVKPEPGLPLLPPIPYNLYPNFMCPGLIPPLNNPLYPPLKFPIFGQRPPFLHPNLPMNLLPPKMEPLSPKVPEQSHGETAQVAPDVEVKVEKKSKEHKKEKRDKIKKKNKKDRLKNKAEKKKLKEERKEKIKKEKKEKRKEKELRETEGAVPKLTLKLGSASPCSETQEARKLNIKPVIKKEEDEAVINEIKTEEGPELAKISALVTGQPKQRISNSLPPSMTSNDNFPTSSTDSFHNQPKKSMFKPIPKIRPLKVRKDSTDTDVSNSTPPSKYLDSEGNEVWICPACGIQDDGSPMIGCDDCDAWYHWVCVGIQIAPHDNEDWYCRHCIVKKQEVLQTDKKKKRKKREKKNMVPV